MIIRPLINYQFFFFSPIIIILATITIGNKATDIITVLVKHFLVKSHVQFFKSSQLFVNRIHSKSMHKIISLFGRNWEFHIYMWRTLFIIKSITHNPISLPSRCQIPGTVKSTAVKPPLSPSNGITDRWEHRDVQQNDRPTDSFPIASTPWTRHPSRNLRPPKLWPKIWLILMMIYVG